MNRRQFLASSAAAVVAGSVLKPDVAAPMVSRVVTAENLLPIRNCSMQVVFADRTCVFGPAKDVMDYMLATGRAVKDPVDPNVVSIEDVRSIVVGEETDADKIRVFAYHPRAITPLRTEDNVKFELLGSPFHNARTAPDGSSQQARDRA